jgi:hypothetical protein
MAVILLLCGCGGGPSPVAVQPPAELSYTTATAVYTQGTAITPNNPTTVGGAAASYSVSPGLPAGLTLSTSTGVIDGTPTAVTSKKEKGGKRVSGTCERIGFTDFGTTHFQCFTQLITGPNSISSHVPGTFFRRS